MVFFNMLVCLMSSAVLTFANLSGDKNQRTSGDEFKDKGENIILAPLAYSSDGKILFGAKYNFDLNQLKFLNTSGLECFLGEINGGKLIDVFFESDTNFRSVQSGKGKFLASINENGNSDLYIINFENGKFKKENIDINSAYDESSGSFAGNGNRIIFSSNRPNGFGGYDLYESEFVGNEWSEPRNLGKNVNSDKDELCPYMLSDEVSLFFSSKRNSNSSNFDIYYCVQEDNGVWRSPEIEASVDKDVLFYIISPDETMAVFYSIDNGGLKGMRL